MYALTLILALAAPQGASNLEEVRRAEARRTSVVARVAPAVCSVMPVDSAGGGSGVIIDPAGYILSNFHVVQRRQQKKKDPVPGPEEGDVPEWFGPELPKPRFEPPDADDDRKDPAWKVMKIGLPDGDLYLADVLGIDPGSDLAILLLRPHPGGKPYPHAELGDSDQLLVGETVFAMGNPFLLATDFTPTVTWGLVSGTHRYQSGGMDRFLVYPDCIQVDAPVNPGNSGGPLFNENGEVVGINGRISIRDRGRVNTGVGFAIASNQIRNFLGDMMAGLHAEHGTLDMNAWFMNSPEKKRRGVFVQATFKDSVVAAHGVGLGDEIVAFNDIEVRSANQLATLIGVLPAGSWVSLTYRKLLEEDKFAPAETVVFQLTRLDTGSSRDEDRGATDLQRQLARSTLTERVGDGEAAAAFASFSMEGPKGQRIALYRSGDSLRREDGGGVLVRTAPGEGFSLRDGAAHDLSLEEGAALDRNLATQPLLWTGEDRKNLVMRSTLEGGTLVFGKPAYRFRLPGDGQREVFLFEDGSAAGCRYRDPVHRQMVEFRFSPDHRRARVIVDDELSNGWTLSVGETQPAAALFERPAR